MPFLRNSALPQIAQRPPPSSHTLFSSHSSSSSIMILRPLPCYSRQSGSFMGLQGPEHRGASPMEEDSIQPPQADSLSLSPGCSKGVICSPQSPLRSDCQPNSPHRVPAAAAGMQP
ncbi:hypothetical protein J4Q44_G00184620 [Coregonus suidteri]|uniref:Uncharacterized protein n=1 Tax=Coregonus suidteri TaxID=861788 RepID=A0AAN8LLB0_9TELE